jgi:hypothetical protein
MTAIVHYTAFVLIDDGIFVKMLLERRVVGYLKVFKEVPGVA